MTNHNACAEMDLFLMAKIASSVLRHRGRRPGRLPKLHRGRVFRARVDVVRHARARGQRDGAVLGRAGPRWRARLLAPRRDHVGRRRAAVDRLSILGNTERSSRPSPCNEEEIGAADSNRCRQDYGRD